MGESHSGRGSPQAELLTVRDWLRYAVTTMTRAGIAFGHGTATAVDEAAFLILEKLGLPVDDINPWLDCRLLEAERTTIAEIVAARISTRKPAPYLTNSAYIQGRRFYVDERVIVPRSFIGELLVADRLASVVADPGAISSVLDLCTGSGCLAILAAEAFPKASVTAGDISNDALAVAERNIGDHGMEQRIKAVSSDLFAELSGARYDLIICNPPYVTTAAVAAFPPEHAAEPTLAHLGGQDGLDIVNRVLLHAARYLERDGHLVMEVGQGGPQLDMAWPNLPLLWLDTETSAGEVFAIGAADLASANRQPKAPK